jgi:hypothetical protein
MLRWYYFALLMPFMATWQSVFGTSPDNGSSESPKAVVCPTVAASGTSASVTEVLTRIADKTEALTKARVEHAASWSEIHALMQIDVVSNMMIGSALVISRSPPDSKATEVSFDELMSHTQLSSKIVNGLIYGDDALALKRTEVPSAISALKDLHCEIAALGENVRKLWEQLGK